MNDSSLVLNHLAQGLRLPRLVGDRIYLQMKMLLGTYWCSHPVRLELLFVDTRRTHVQPRASVSPCEDFDVSLLSKVGFVDFVKNYRVEEMAASRVEQFLFDLVQSFHSTYPRQNYLKYLGDTH